MTLVSLGFSTQEQVRVEFREYVNQEVMYNPLKTGSGTWTSTNEFELNYSLRGEIIVFNLRPDGESVSDILLTFDNVGNITLPTHSAGRVGNFVSNNLSSGSIQLYIPELNTGENSTWVYDINASNIRPVLNLESNYSFPKILAGNNLSITDTLINEFDNYSFQTDFCIHDISLVQDTIAVNFSGVFTDIEFDATSTTGPDSTNVTYSSDNLTQTWDVLNGNCLNNSTNTSITYLVLPPNNFPTSGHYEITNSTLSYKLNETISHLRLTNILAVSEANLGFDKRIVGPTFLAVPDFNVTWNITGYFNTTSNISYQLNEVTLWVSQRNVNGSYTDPNTVDTDTVGGGNLTISFAPGTIINLTNSWFSNSWLFNYTDIPSPIVWMDANFTILNDGVQLINRSVVQNERDVFIKELYVIVGYWLEVNKNVTSISNDSYRIKIEVKNKGNSATPENAIVTVYDFLPSNYNLSSSYVYSDVGGGWYTSISTNNTIGGNFQGTLIQWALTPTSNGGLNASLDGYSGTFHSNNTWSVEYNITGFGDYSVMDVYIAGLDPQKVDGAGSSKETKIFQDLSLDSGIETLFAIAAGLLVVLEY